MSTDLATTVADPKTVRAAGVWDYISPSRLILWLKCPLAFRLRYIDGMRQPASTSQFLGKMVHFGLECFYRQRQQGIAVSKSELAICLHDEWEQAVCQDGVQFDSQADEVASQRQAVALLGAYLDQLPGDEPAPLAVEEMSEARLIDPQSGEDLGIALLGIIDLVLPTTTGPIITDFKTAARGGELLEIMHEIQLTSYAYLLRQSFEQPESGLEIRSLIKTKTPKIENHRYPPRTAGHFTRLFRVIRAYLDDLSRGQFLYRPGFGCGMCEFRHASCQQWSG